MRESAKLTTLLFHSSEPVNNKALCNYFGIDETKLAKLVEDTNKKLKKLGLIIINNKSEVILVTQPCYSSLIEKFYRSSPQTLSQAALEVLSIIAYKQPITKTHIDEIRGVSSDQSIKNLVNKQLIKSTIKDNAVYYQTTMAFLNAMGITSLKDLPQSSDEESKN